MVLDCQLMRVMASSAQPWMPFLNSNWWNVSSFSKNFWIYPTLAQNKSRNPGNHGDLLLQFALGSDKYQWSSAWYYCVGILKNRENKSRIFCRLFFPNWRLFFVNQMFDIFHVQFTHHFNAEKIMLKNKIVIDISLKSNIVDWI